MKGDEILLPADHPAARFMTQDIALCADDRPTLLMIAEPDAWGCLEAAATAVGARLLGSVCMDEAAIRLDRIAHVDMIVLCCARPHAALPGLLTRLDAMAAANDAALVMVTSMDCLDIAYAHHRAPATQWLCDPRDTELAAAITLGLRMRERDPLLRDIGREGDSARIDRLSEEVGRIARALDVLTERSEASQRPEGSWLAERQGGYVAQPAAASLAPMGDELTAGHIRALLRTRRLRDHFLPPDMFADPAWDMLLDLMAARLSGEQVSVSSLCIAAAVPPTTALRWIRQLTDRGIFLRQADPADGRRVFIALSDDAAAAITQWYVARRRILRDEL
ncbi:MarR family transcriptional regulator [Sphingobium phenoxybenzoativorans]|nr:MarR family transcriptional regulator [Sphingobium phenoxybenzoativorans]